MTLQHVCEPVILVVMETIILCMISMQDFEIDGHAMQLGWGQENREEKFSNASGDSRVMVKDQKHLSDKVGG